MRKMWSKEEVSFLKKLYEMDGLSLSELISVFNKIYDRTIESVSVKIGRLKLRHTKQQISDIKSRLYSGNGNGMFGKTSAMKGFTKENSEIVRNKSKKLSETRNKMFKEGNLPSLAGENNPMFGKDSWCKGLNKNTDDRLLNAGLKISRSRKLEWLNKTDEEKLVVTKRLNDAMIQSRKPTKIENKIEEYINELGLTYIKNFRIKGFLADFYIQEYNLVIECDGDYWHFNPDVFYNKTPDNIQLKTIDRDKRKEKMLIENNIEYIRFWEYDIHNNFNDVKNKLCMKLQKK